MTTPLYAATLPSERYPDPFAEVEVEAQQGPQNHLPILLNLPCAQVVEVRGSAGGDVEEASVGLQLSPGEARALAAKLVEAARAAESGLQVRACPGCGQAACAGTEFCQGAWAF